MTVTHKDFILGEVYASTVERIREYIKQVVNNRQFKDSELYAKITAEETLPSILHKTVESMRKAAKTACEYCDDFSAFEYSITGTEYDNEKKIYRCSILIGIVELKEG
jgi:hypothetical protein